MCAMFPFRSFVLLIAGPGPVTHSMHRIIEKRCVTLMSRNERASLSKNGTKIADGSKVLYFLVIIEGSGEGGVICRCINFSFCGIDR